MFLWPYIGFGWVKMKKSKFTLAAQLLIILSSCGCAFKEYSGDYPDLYAVAINSVLWVNGYSWGADFECDPQIEKIDKDNYGRVMFFYQERNYKGSEIWFSALVVCQASNDSEVFYYEDEGYIIKGRMSIARNTAEVFNAEDIDYLKSINDWNKELDYEKCVKKTIIKNKPSMPYKKEIEKRIMDEFNLNDEKCSVFMDYLTNNSDDSKFLIYGHIRMKIKGAEDISFVGLAEKENDSIVKLNTFVPSDVYDYKAEFMAFKQANNW